MRRRNRWKYAIACIVVLVAMIVGYDRLRYYANRPRDRYAAFLKDGHFDCSSTPVLLGSANCIFATPATGNGDIYIASLNDRKFIPLVTSEATEYAPGQSANSEFLAFARRAPNGDVAIWVLDRQNAVTNRLLVSSMDDIPIGVSNDGRIVIVQRREWEGGLAELEHARVISMEPRLNRELGRNGTFDADGAHIWSCKGGLNAQAKRRVIRYDTQTLVGTDICRGIFIATVGNQHILVRDEGRAPAIVDLSGNLVRKLEGLSGSSQLAVGGDFVAGDSKFGILILQHNPDSAVQELRLPSGLDVTHIMGSPYGFTVVAIGLQNFRWHERIFTSSPPFSKWEFQFSATDLSCF